MTSLQLKPGLGPPASSIEIVVRDPASGVIFAQMSLQFPGLRGQLAPMQPLTAGTPVVGTDATDHTAVAGRIAATGNTLPPRIDAWLEHLRARGRKPRSIAAFRQVVTRAMGVCGWRSAEDVTYESVSAYFSSQRWAGTTFNRNISVFRSLTSFLSKVGDLPQDPLSGLERATADGADGSRAATIDEARAMILHAWVRDRADRRCKGNRALYWLCLFAAGCRVSEPALWRRRHVCLDDAVPHIAWTADINKSRKRRECALAPELAELLRLHLEAQDTERATAGLSPAGRDDRVFPTVPSRTSFRADRDAAGIAAVDRRDRPFTPHSARKFLATQLRAEEKMVDFLLRHAGRVEHRYFDPPLGDQAEALKKLPRLWPPQSRQSCGAGVDNSDSGGFDLTSGPARSEDGPGTQVRTGSPTRSRPDPTCPECQQSAGHTGRERDVERIVRAVWRGRDEGPETVESNSVMRPEMPISDRITENDLKPLADLFEALAGLLRTRSSGHGDSGRGRA